MTTLTDQTIKNIVRNLLLRDRDYRLSVIDQASKEFLEYAVEFFKDIFHAKLCNQVIDVDWYKKEIIGRGADSNSIATAAGINMKTIRNIYSTGRREVVIDAACENYEVVKNLIEKLTEEHKGINIKLTIKFRQCSVDLDLNESLIVINALAVKRMAITGGKWSQVGKKAEAPLMLALCLLYSVPKKHYSLKRDGEQRLPGKNYEREADFFLKDKNGEEHRCEIKLMGKGNPESADSALARDAEVLIADTLSETVIEQINDKKIHWVHLRDEKGYRRFGDVLKSLDVPYVPYIKIPPQSNDDIDKAVQKSFFLIKQSLKDPAAK